MDEIVDLGCCTCNVLELLEILNLYLVQYRRTDVVIALYRSKLSSIQHRRIFLKLKSTVVNDN